RISTSNHNFTDSFCSKKWNQVHSREQQTNILFRYPPSMHRLIFHHASPKTQEKGGNTTINAASEEVFGTMDAGPIIGVQAVIYPSVIQPLTVGNPMIIHDNEPCVLAGHVY